MRKVLVVFGEFVQLKHLVETNYRNCLKSVQIQNFFWSVFSRILTEYGKIRTRKNSVFGHFPHSACFGHKTEFSFNYKNLLLLKKQNQYAQKFKRVKFFYNTQIFLHSFEVTRGSTTTELKIFYNVEPFKLKLRVS